MSNTLARFVVTARRIVAPPLGMSTGLAMFLLPAARVPWTWAAAAFLLGALVFAIPIVRTTGLVQRGGEIRMKRSRAILPGVDISMSCSVSRFPRRLGVVVLAALAMVLISGPRPSCAASGYWKYEGSQISSTNEIRMDDTPWVRKRLSRATCQRAQPRLRRLKP